MGDVLLVVAGLAAFGYGIWAFFTGTIGFFPQHGHVWRSDDHQTGRQPGSATDYDTISAEGPLAKGLGVTLALFGFLLLSVVGLDAMGVEQAAAVKESLGSIVGWYVEQD